MTEKEWKRRMAALALVLMPLGVLLMGIGAVWASGPSGLVGYSVGAVGVTFLVLGALCGKFAAWGPVPASVRRDA